MIQFGNPAMLWALPLLIVPILLHLRRKPAEPPTVPFSATHLLQQVAAQSARRAWLRELLLLAVRLLLLAVIVLAFARPYVARSSPGNHLSTDTPTGVRVIADDHKYLDAALPGVEPGPNALVFLGEKPSVPEPELGAKLAGIETGEVAVAAGPYFHPALAMFDEPGHGDLRKVRAQRWWKLEPTGKTIVVARFSNGDPFLIEHWSEQGRIITCALPADASWSDLPLHANFVPLVNELTGYLRSATTERGPPTREDGGPRSVATALFALALALTVAEMLLGRFHPWKLAPAALLVLLIVHPTFSWRTSGVRQPSVVVIADRTDSMRFRPMPGNLPRVDVEVSGHHTALGEAILALTNRSPSAVILASDGQHNSGVSPAWAAAMLGVPVFTVAVGEPEPPRDVSIVRLDVTDLVFSGEEAIVNATIAVHGFEQQQLTASIHPFLTTNVEPGAVSLRFQPEGTGLYTLSIEPLAGEVTMDNNIRSFAVTFVPHKIRVFLHHDAPDWEFRHLRHALQRDPAVELVEDSSRADFVIVTTNETWRLRAFGSDLFDRYWRDRVRSKFRGSTPPAVSEEIYALGRNDELLREVARVSAGKFFTAETLGELPAALQAGVSRERRQFDLRDSWLILLTEAAAFLVSWARRRA